MRMKQRGKLLCKKQQYETPQVKVCGLNLTDIVRTSGNGTMGWADDWNGNWTPNRDDTFVD